VVVFLQFYSLGYLYILPNNRDSLLHLPSKFFSVVSGLFFFTYSTFKTGRVSVGLCFWAIFEFVIFIFAGSRRKLPLSHDWRNHEGVLTESRNQGSTCN
jgi:hypothetical protein